MFSRSEIRKIIKLKITIKIIKIYEILPIALSKKVKKTNKIADLKKTAFLKTLIIENECSIKLIKDILEGPKYLRPLLESFRLNY